MINCPICFNKLKNKKYLEYTEKSCLNYFHYFIVYENKNKQIETIKLNLENDNSIILTLNFKNKTSTVKFYKQSNITHTLDFQKLLNVDYQNLSLTLKEINQYVCFL